MMELAIAMLEERIRLLESSVSTLTGAISESMNAISVNEGKRDSAMAEIEELQEAIGVLSTAVRASRR
jgi:hypothetical protein